MVYDAVAGVCVDTAPGYPVLNGRCNEYYEPGENPKSTNVVPTWSNEAKTRPWMHGVVPN